MPQFYGNLARRAFYQAAKLTVPLSEAARRVRAGAYQPAPPPVSDGQAEGAVRAAPNAIGTQATSGAGVFTRDETRPRPRSRFRIGMVAIEGHARARAARRFSPAIVYAPCLRARRSLSGPWYSTAWHKGWWQMCEFEPNTGQPGILCRSPGLSPPRGHLRGKRGASRRIGGRADT